MSRSRHGCTGWFKSSRSSETQSCVEVRFDEREVLVRDSKYLRNPANDSRNQPYIKVPGERWNGFLELALSTCGGTAAREGGNADTGMLTVDLLAGGDVMVASSAQNVELVFTPEEWDAFVAGIKDGEFTRA